MVWLWLVICLVYFALWTTWSRDALLTTWGRNALLAYTRFAAWRRDTLFSTLLGDTLLSAIENHPLVLGLWSIRIVGQEAHSVFGWRALWYCWISDGWDRVNRRSIPVAWGARPICSPCFICVCRCSKPWWIRTLASSPFLFFLFSRSPGCLLFFIACGLTGFTSLGHGGRQCVSV